MASRNTYKEDEILEEPFNIKHLLRAWVYVKKHANKMLFALILSALGAVAGLFVPLIQQIALDETIPDKNTKFLFILAGLMILTYLVSVVFTTIRSRIMTKVGQDIIYDIRRDLFEHLQRLPFQ